MNIDEIKARAEAATPGPWEAIKSTTGDYSLFAKINRALYMLGDVEETPDADFIAHAREDIPFLLEQLAATQKQLDAAVEDFENMAHSGGNLCEFCSADCVDAGHEEADNTFQCGCFKLRGAERNGDNG